MLGIVFTTTEEAAAYVNQYTDGRSETLEAGRPLQLEHALVVATGPGKIKATLATERFLRDNEVQKLLHTGTCSPLTEDEPPSPLLGASFVLEGDRVELDAPTYPRMPLECPFEKPFEGTLVSQDHTSDDEELSYWERIADARDSTGYAVAYVAAQHGTPCHIVKAVVSPDDTSDTLPTSEKQAADTIASFLSDTVEDLNASLT